MSASFLSVARRRVRAGAAATVLAAAVAVVALASPASAATTTIYTSPSGTGNSCSSAQPCSLPAAQAAVRSQNGSMSGDIVVQLAGVYRLTAPLRLTTSTTTMATRSRATRP